MKSRKKLQDIFFITDEELRLLQEELFQLEKEASRVGQLFVNLEKKLGKLQDQLEIEKYPRLFRRLSQIRFHLRSLEYRHSYKSEIFTQLSEAITLARKKLPEEILPLPQSWREKTIIYPPITERKPKLTLKDKLPFYSLQNGSMFFLIPAKKMLFKANVPNREKVTLKLLRGNFPRTYTFIRLPGEDPLEKKSESKKAFLFSYKNHYISVLADKCLGKIYLSPALFRKKIAYLKVETHWYEAYLVIGGKRYYLLKPHLDLVKEKEKSLAIPNTSFN